MGIGLAVDIWGTSDIGGMIGPPVGSTKGIVDIGGTVDVVVGTMGGGEVV